jgi:AraC-like DNA-binding protein
MDFKIIHPKKPIIKEFLKFSYTGTLENVSYHAYPSPFIPICFFKNVSISISSNKMTISPSTKESIKCIYANNFYKPINIEMQGVIEEFCLIFHPYGLAQFIKKLPAINSNTHSLLFYEFDDFTANHPGLFTYTPQEKSDALESYLASKISIKKYTDYIKDAVLKMNSEKNLRHIYPISSKTFYRAFKNICGVPESVLLKTIQFRKALEKIKTEDPEKTMAQLAFDLGYYDQPHFNKVFKQLSSETPSTFFKHVDTISEKKIYFKIK